MTPPPPSPEDDAPTSAAPLVLVVDDDERNRRLTQDVLRAARFRTIEAATGGECLALAAEHLPDLVLLDLHLPDVSGVDVARMLSTQPGTSAMPVVALSASRDVGQAERLLADGFAGYLEKPIDVAEFPDQVRGFIRS